MLLYAPPWDGPTRFSKHHLACYFAKRGARVLYVEAPLTPMGVRRGPGFLSELRETLRPPRSAAKHLWVRRHFLPVPYHAATSLTNRRAANVIGQRLLAPVLRRDLLRLGMRQPIVIAGLPHAADIVVGGHLPRRLLIYHCADDYAHVRGFPASLPQVEAELCRQAQLVITTSETLRETRRQWNPQTHWIPNGADVDHFSKTAVPAPELADVPRPIVGFVGGLSEWVDLDLLAFLARQRPGWSFVLVGPLTVDLASIRCLPNVRLLGPRAYRDLPAYLAAMDVALIPFKRNDVTFHADPIKAYEYLAAGLPIVATDLPALRRLSHVVHLADSPEGFLAEIDAALARGREWDREERRAEAARHSWDARFAVLEQLICDRMRCAS